MSRWLAEPLRIGLAPGEVALRLGGTTRVQPAQDEQPGSLLPALEQALHELPEARAAYVTLSQKLVRHTLTPDPGKALRRDEELALARASLEMIFGREATDWRVAVHSQPPGAGLFAAAIDAGLADALESLLARHGARRIHIGPVLRDIVRSLPQRYSGWVACAEPGWITLLAATRGTWRHHAVLPCGPDWQTLLPDWLMREAVAVAPAPPATLALRSLGPQPATPLALADWKFLNLGHAAGTTGAAALIAA